jgi:DNA modification methylase
MSSDQLYLKREEFKCGIYYLGNARDLIKTIPNESIDLILTDPPFGLEMDEFDDPNVFFELEDEMWRVLKKDAWLVFFYSIKKLPEAFKFKKFEYAWQIICHFPTPFSKSVLGDRCYLPILVFRKGKPKIYYRRYDVIPADELPFVIELVKDPRYKPTFTISVLLHMFTRENDFVLDPFAGFGSIPIVAEFFKRKWFAFEIDERKFNIAVKFIREGKVEKIANLRKEKSNHSLEPFFFNRSIF